MTDVTPLLTPNLRLDAIRPETVEALLTGDASQASVEQGVELTEEFLESVDDFFLRVQLSRMTANPAGQEWCARTMVRVSDGTVVGHCGFHGPPEDVGRAEIGYTVLKPFRGMGFATEAASALVAFARERGVRTVFATAAPANLPSLRVLAKLGFVQTGTEVDEIDGEELVFELELPDD